MCQANFFCIWHVPILAHVLHEKVDLDVRDRRRSASRMLKTIWDSSSNFTLYLFILDHLPLLQIKVQILTLNLISSLYLPVWFLIDTYFKELRLLKVPFLSENEIRFSNLPANLSKILFQKTILSLSLNLLFTIIGGKFKF